MKDKRTPVSISVQELCQKLKEQLEELTVEVENTQPQEEKARRTQLMEQLKAQLNELSH